MKIGIVGLGHMGSAISRNLLRRGHFLAVYDTRKDAINPLADAGARVARTPKELAEISEYVITSLPGPVQIEEVYFDRDGLLNGVSKGSVLMDTSTSSPKLARRIARHASEKGAMFLDAPVSGGQARAEAGSLAIMVGGDTDAYEKALPLLRDIGEPFYLGGHGKGMQMKLVNQLITTVELAAISESVVLAKKCGIDPRVAFAVLKTGAANSAILTLDFPPALTREFDQPVFPVRLASKDIRLVTDLGKEMCVPLFVAEAAEKVYRIAEKKGLSEKDQSSIITVYEDGAGL